MAETIKFRPIPPRSPHLNGNVERAQRTVLEEFWASVDTRAPGIGDQLAVWVHHYNWDRAHEALGGLCPIDRVCERADKTPIWARSMPPTIRRGSACRSASTPLRRRYED